jgi:formiminotetrahydrofolate cyclodeaminase
MESLEDYLDALASAAPTPGGGSAATIVGAMGAALVAMVARITFANPKFAQHAAHAEKLIGAADAMRVAFLDAREHDERAYAGVVAAMALPRASDGEKAERATRLQSALAEAASAPLAATTLAISVLTQAIHAKSLENRNLESDVACAAFFARAAFEASAANVRVNHVYMKNAELVAAQERTLGENEIAFANYYRAFESNA